MAILRVTITPDSNDGTIAHLSAVFSGGSESYSYARQLRVTVLGNTTYTLNSAETSGGYNTWSATITGLEPNVTYSWSAEVYYRTTGGWANSGYRDNGTFTTAPPAAQTYYAYISFNANGGSGAPSTQYGSETNNTGYVTFYLPSTRPSKTGYTFAGWSLNSDGSGTVYSPGGKIILWSGTTSSPGQGYTLYAVWVEDTTGRVWLSQGGAFGQGILYCSDGSKFYKGIPWVGTGPGWRRGV